jgi:hypothetical protein
MKQLQCVEACNISCSRSFSPVEVEGQPGQIRGVFQVAGLPDGKRRKAAWRRE